MQDFIVLSAQFHLFFIVSWVILILINIYLLRSDMPSSKLVPWLKLFAPQYYIVLSAIFFTGIIIMAVREFNASHVVWLMVIAWIGIIATSIKTHKRFKQIDSKEAFVAYKAVAIKKYLIDALILTLTSLLYYGV